MSVYYLYNTEENYLAHHGIKGQKWGVRRFQNPDGSLTPAGEKRQKRLEAKEQKKEERLRKKRGSDDYAEVQELKKKQVKELTNEELEKIAKRKELEKAIKSGDEETKRLMVQSGMKLLGTAATVAAITLGGKYVIDHLPEIAGKVAKQTTKATVNVTKEVAKGGLDLAKSAGEAAAKAGHEVRKNVAKSSFAKSYVGAIDRFIGKKKRK